MDGYMTDYYVNWDVAEARALEESGKYVGPSYDLSKPEDRARCFLAYCRDSYGGGSGLWCQAYDFDRTNMDAHLDRGEPLSDRNQRQLNNYREEFESLASNSPRWAELNHLGGLRK